MTDAVDVVGLLALLAKQPDETWIAPKKSSIVGSGIVASPFGRVVAVTIPSSDDAALIVAGRNALPALLDENAALRVEVERLQAENAVLSEELDCVEQEGCATDDQIMHDAAEIAALRARCDALAGEMYRAMSIMADIHANGLQKHYTKLRTNNAAFEAFIILDAAPALHRGEQGQ